MLVLILIVYTYTCTGTEGDTDMHDDYIEYVSETYTFKNNSDNLNSRSTRRNKNKNSQKRVDIDDDDNTSSFLNQSDILNARIFDVSSTRCTCPNCGDTLLLPLLSQEERSSVKSALMDLITERKSPKKLAHIKSFESWLEENGPYKYIVDGANVGYNRQNCANGRFSYQQVYISI